MESWEEKLKNILAGSGQNRKFLIYLHSFTSRRNGRPAVIAKKAKFVANFIQDIISTHHKLPASDEDKITKIEVSWKNTPPFSLVDIS